MTQNTIDELIKINEDLVQNNTIDADTYHSILTRLEYLRDNNEMKLNTALTALGSCRIDILVSPYIQQGIAKMLVNIADFHQIMKNQQEKINTNTEPHTPQN